MVKKLQVGVVVEMVNVSSTSLTCYMKPNRVAGRLHSSLAQMMLETAVASLYLIFLNFSAFGKIIKQKLVIDFFFFFFSVY